MVQQQHRAILELLASTFQRATVEAEDKRLGVVKRERAAFNYSLLLIGQEIS